MPKIDLTQQVQGVLPPANGGFPGGPYTLAGLLALVENLFADAEIPAGTQNGSNVTFTLKHVPSPALSLILTQNGLVRRQGVHYTLVANTITWVSAPAGPDDIQCWYRFLPTIAEEEFWTNEVLPICQTYAPFYQWLCEMNEEAHGLFGCLEEEYWQNQVAPVASTYLLLQQWQFEMHEPAGMLHFTMEEEYWQNSTKPSYQLYKLFYQWLCDMQEQAHGLYAEDEDYNWSPTVMTQPWLYPQPFSFDSSQQDLG